MMPFTRRTSEIEEELSGGPTHLVLVHTNRSEIGIVEQFVRFDINRRLSPAFVAQHPLRVDQSPEGRTL